MRILLVALLLGIAGCNHTTEPYYIPTAKVIGDSISKGYLPAVERELHGQVKVSHACSDQAFDCNNGQTGTILEKMDKYFPTDPDIVTFNSGIHDMSLQRGFAGSACLQSSLRVPPGQFYENITRIADYIKAHSRVAIWVDITTLPDTICAGRFRDSYNAMAEQIARDHGFYILHIDSKYHDKSGIHFTLAGYKYLADQVSACIVTAWEGKATDACERTD